jgi:uncharacterized damage-inducible protein DinB
MNDPRLREVLGLLDPPTGGKLWHGGAGVLGTLRGVRAEQAIWTPAPDRHSVWELSLHIAYWKYAVRRRLTGEPKGGFARTPSNWPRPPEIADEPAWQKDRALLRQEHSRLIEVVRGLDPGRLDETPDGGGGWRYADLLMGIVLHDTYHAGQIQILKRIYSSQQ